MASEAVNQELAEAIDAVAASLDRLRSAGVTPVNSLDAITVIRETERLGRQLDAVLIDVLDGLDRSGFHLVDGHRTAKVMVRHVGRLSNREAARRARAVKALRDLPVVRAGFRAGRIGPCQVALIARVHANKRVRSRLLELDSDLARSAAHRTYPEFEMLLRNWETLTDEDGCADTNQRNHDNRDASLLQDYDTSWNLRAGCAALHGAAMNDIFQAFVDAEFAADWATARAEWGDAAGAHLPRTDAQRRFDTLYAIFNNAADVLATEAGGTRITTNIVIDQDTFERIATKLTGATPEAPTFDFDPTPDTDPTDEDLEADDVDTTETTETDTAPTSPVGFRCSTLDGHPLDPTEAVAHALLGHIRRVVVGADSTVIDLGRRRRLFTGAAQLAVKLSTTWCYWPGCNVPVTNCQTDHLTSWHQHHGRTHPGNGGPACGKHNRHKQHGYTAHRDQAGTWHVHRPDGTEIE